MKIIILDTNFLTIPFQFGLDIFKEIDESLSKGRSNNSTAARIGLELIKKRQVKIIKTKGKNADDEIVELSNDKTIVATNDKELINRLKNKNIKVIYLRGKSRLNMR